jgi:GMP synthase-like glutamine amidotransferase
MNIQVFQNISFEGPAFIEEIAEKNGYGLHVTRLFDGENPLPPTDYDMLVIMGGPMNIYEESEYPWLINEKKAIEQAINSEKIVFGICLGAQLLADILGAEVYKNEEREIGWFPVHRMDTETDDKHLSFLPDKMTVFHWHSETFRIPGNAVRIYSSEATENQSFIYENKVLAMQFHLEMKKSSIKDLAYYCEYDIEPSKFVMEKGKMLKLYKKYEEENKKVLKDIFRHFLGEE